MSKFNRILKNGVPPSKECDHRPTAERGLGTENEKTNRNLENTESQPSAENGEIVMPPAPPGESSLSAVRKTQAVADALKRLGENANPIQVAEAVKQLTGIILEFDEANRLMAALHRHAHRPVKPD